MKFPIAITQSMQQGILAKAVSHVSKTLDFMYGTKERAECTIGMAYLLLALGMIMYSSGTTWVCTLH